MMGHTVKNNMLVLHKKLDSILAEFNKTQQQLQEFLERSDKEIDRMESELVQKESENARATRVLERIKGLTQ